MKRQRDFAIQKMVKAIRQRNRALDRARFFKGLIKDLIVVDDEFGEMSSSDEEEGGLRQVINSFPNEFIIKCI